MTRHANATTAGEEINNLNDAARWAPRLERLLTEQESLYAELNVLSAGQANLIEAGNAERLLEVLTQRQGLLARLETSNDELAPFRERWDDLMRQLSEEQRNRFNSRIDAMRDLIESIAARDDADGRTLSARRVEVAARLGEVTRCKSAMSAYGKPRSGGPRYQDREG